METVFYIAGIALILIALAISLIGIRSESFPSTGVMRAGVAFVALVVVVVAYSAIGSAQDEQQKRRDEANREAAVEAEAVTADNEASGSGEIPNPAAQGPGPRDETDGAPVSPDQGPGAGTKLASGDPKAGAGVFIDQGCGSCHTLAAAGDSALGQIGPNLDEALVDRDTTFIQTSIVDPGAFVEEGFGDGIMPVDFGDVIASKDLANLVAYLSQSTSGGK